MKFLPGTTGDTRCGQLNMRTLAWQVMAVALVIAPIARGDERERWRRQLADECDALIAVAVKRPYGWAWPSEFTTPPPSGRRIVVSMQPGDTPAAGLSLLWAAGLLNEPKYAEAAVQAARGVAAAQQTSGRIASHPIFGPSAGTHEPPAAVPDRAATRAGLALLVAAIGADPSKDEQFQRSARHAAAWLMKQQTADGGWPVAYPPEAPPDDSKKIIYLASPDYRDSTFATYLAADALNDKLAGRAASDSVAKLLALRLSSPRQLSNTWAIAYRLDGELIEDDPTLPPGADVQATRYAMQTLLAACVMTRDAESRNALAAARKALLALRDPADESWKRIVALDPRTVPTTTESMFGPTTAPAMAELTRRGTFGLPTMVDAVERLETTGVDEYELRLREWTSPREQLALALVGLSDEPFITDWPRTREEAERFIELHGEAWKRLDAPLPATASERAFRIYWLLVRARLQDVVAG